MWENFSNCQQCPPDLVVSKACSVTYHYHYQYICTGPLSGNHAHDLRKETSSPNRSTGHAFKFYTSEARHVFPREHPSTYIPCPPKEYEPIQAI